MLTPDGHLKDSGGWGRGGSNRGHQNQQSENNIVFLSISQVCLHNMSDFYSYFDLEYEHNCNYDSLCVYGVKFCGNWLTGRTLKYIIAENSTFTMVFKTDEVEVKPGFEVNCLKV